MGVSGMGESALVPPLKWHGGKQYLARRIVALMPRHIHYVEPFAGGMAVLFEKNPEGVSEVVNDLNGELVNFWTVLQHQSYFGMFARAASVSPFSEELWETAGDPNSFLPLFDQAYGSAGVSRAFAFFIRCRQSMSGRMDCFAPLSRTRTRRGMNEQASAWLNVVEGLPAVHARLKRVVILNRPAVEVIRQQDGPDTLFYLDPPYLHETRATTGEYAHEMTETQHFDLLKLLSRIKGKFLLSGYRSAMYDGDAERFGWRRIDFDLPNNAAGGKTKRRMTECVWANYALTP